MIRKNGMVTIIPIVEIVISRNLIIINFDKFQKRVFQHTHNDRTLTVDIQAVIFPDCTYEKNGGSPQSCNQVSEKG